MFTVPSEAAGCLPSVIQPVEGFGVIRGSEFMVSRGNKCLELRESTGKE